MSASNGIQKTKKLKVRVGFLVRNEKKKGPSYPDYIGAVKLDKAYYAGKRLFIMGWVQEIDGKKLLKIKVASRDEAMRHKTKEQREAIEKKRKQKLARIIEWKKREKALTPPVEVYREDIMR